MITGGLERLNWFQKWPISFPKSCDTWYSPRTIIDQVLEVFGDLKLMVFV